MEFRILGPLEVAENGSAVDLGAAKQQTLLGVLLLHIGEVVSTARLVDELWGDAPPATAPKAIQGYVHGLRKVLGPEAIGTRAGGYVAAIDPTRLDASRFERLAAEGQRWLRADPARAAAHLGEALSLWRGNVLEGLPLTSRGELDRLAERRMVVLERRIDADLELGRHAETVPELRELVAAEPYRESLRARLMLALYRCGRQAEALDVYRDTRHLLTEELALEPGEELRRLELQILAHAPELERPNAPAPPATTAPVAAPAARRLVTVVRGAVADPDAVGDGLDPEALHAVLARSWKLAATVIERHGGTVDHVADDAIVAVFGLTEAHDDDALRAVRAAADLRASVEIELRVGVVTGRVFVAGAQATGSPMNGARRLETAAASGEILLDERTRRLVAHATTGDGAGAAWRLATVRPELVPAPAATPLVGRETELGAVLELLSRVSDEPGCRLVTLLGPPGIGKSRLARELFERVRGDATVLVGRCLAYGEGITYRPLAEIVRQVGASRLEELVGAGAAGRILGAIGASGEPGRSDETFWAFRRLFDEFHNVRVANRAGIVALYQELSIIPSISVAENILLGEQTPSRGGIVQWGALRRRAREQLDRHPPEDPAGQARRRAVAGSADHGRVRPRARDRRPGAHPGRADRVADRHRDHRAVHGAAAACATRASRSSTCRIASRRCSSSATASPSCATARRSSRRMSPTRNIDEVISNMVGRPAESCTRSARQPRRGRPHGRRARRSARQGRVVHRLQGRSARHRRPRRLRPQRTAAHPVRGSEAHGRRRSRSATRRCRTRPAWAGHWTPGSRWFRRNVARRA